MREWKDWSNTESKGTHMGKCSPEDMVLKVTFDWLNTIS